MHSGFREVHWDFYETELSSLPAMAGAWVQQQPYRYLATSIVVPVGFLQGAARWWLRIGCSLIVDGSQDGEVLGDVATGLGPHPWCHFPLHPL